MSLNKKVFIIIKWCYYLHIIIMCSLSNVGFLQHIKKTFLITIGRSGRSRPIRSQLSPSKYSIHLCRDWHKANLSAYSCTFNKVWLAQGSDKSAGIATKSQGCTNTVFGSSSKNTGCCISHNASLLCFQVLSMKSLKKQVKKIKNMTVKDMVTTLVSFYWSVLLSLLHVAFSVARGFCRIFYNTFMGGNLVEGAKTIKVILHD